MTITNYALIRHEFDFSAVYVAEDSTLHQSIRSFAVKESKLLDSMHWNSAHGRRDKEES